MHGIQAIKRAALAALAALFAASLDCEPAAAQIKLEFSGDVDAAFKYAGKDSERERQQAEQRINRGLEELGKANPDAKTLFESKQTLRLVCYGSDEAKKAGLEQSAGMVTSDPASTRGDFEAGGKPKAGGTAIIAVDCDQFKLGGFEKIVAFEDTMFHIIVHELLHAANEGRKHPPDDAEIYVAWVQDFMTALGRTDAAPGRRRRGSTAESVPATPRTMPTPSNVPNAPRDVGQTSAPSDAPGTRLAPFDFRIRGGIVGGGIFGPGFDAGTQFDPVAAREVSILRSPRNIDSLGGEIEFEASLRSLFGTTVTSTFSEIAFYAKLQGYSFWGSEKAKIPIGGNNVAFNYIFANPATNTAGVLAGSTGQRISVKTEGEAIQMNSGLKWSGPRLSANPSITTEIGVGATYEYFDQGYKITQKSLTFRDVSAITKLRVDEHFIAPHVRVGVMADDGVFYGSATAFVAPGILITDATARQRNRCGPCPNPQDRSFTLERSFSDTQFRVQTGFNFKLGARITRAIALEAGLNYEYSSRAAFLRPPITPAEQPVSLDYGSRSKLFGALSLTYRW